MSQQEGMPPSNARVRALVFVPFSGPVTDVGPCPPSNPEPSKGQPSFRLCQSCHPRDPNSARSRVKRLDLCVVPLFLADGGRAGLAGAGHPAGGRRPGTRVQEGGALQCREDPQPASLDLEPCSMGSHARELLQRHLLQLSGQLFGVHTRRPLPT